MHNLVFPLTDHSKMGDALWFEVWTDLGKFSIKDFGLITGLNCVDLTYLKLVNENNLQKEYFSIYKQV